MTPPAPVTAPRWPTREEWRTAALLVLATRIAFWLVAWLARWLLADGPGRIRPGVSHWRRWDADIYVKIAEHGYAGPGAEPWSEAFPPGWPLLLRAASTLGLEPTVAALGLTTVATVVAVAYLLRLVADERPDDADAGRRAALYLLLFPTAVFLVAGYSEALFLAGAVPAFREARLGRWPRVALPAAAAVASRWTGLFLLIGLGVELLRQLAAGRADGRAAAGDGRGRLLARGAGALAVGLVPFLAFAAWLGATRGDPWYFLTAQREGWGRSFVGPVESFRATWDTWDTDHSTALLLSWRLEILAAAAGVALVVVLVRRREWGYAAYAASTLAVLLTSSWYYSVPRALLVLFPAVVVLADLTRRRPLVHDALVAVFAAVATLGVVVFTSGRWFS